MMGFSEVADTGNHKSRSGWKKRAVAAACGVLASLTLLPAARADVLDFNSVDIGYHFDGDVFQHGNYQFTSLYEGDPAYGGGLVGAVFDGTDLGVCGNMTCPTNNLSNYYAALNDGLLSMKATSGTAFHVTGFDSSYINPLSDHVADPAVLAIQGVRADGSIAEEYYSLYEPAWGFLQYHTSTAFSAESFVQVNFYAYSCNYSGNCYAFNSNKAQFALDNINVTAVPEPASYAMLGLGLAVLGVVARRRRPV